MSLRIWLHAGVCSGHANGLFALHFHNHQPNVGMKTERKRTELSGATFVFIFFYGSGNKNRNPKNKYGTGHYRKQIQIEYGMDTERNADVRGTKRILKLRRKSQQFKQINKHVL
jgi:hypothetical protein